MREIVSDLGTKMVPGQGRATHVVEDLSQDLSQELPTHVRLSPEQTQQFQQQRQEMVSEQSRLPSAAKKRIEMLADIGRLHVDHEIEGHVFGLRSLKAKEMKEAVKLVSQSEDVATAFNMRDSILAFALYQIDGSSVALILGEDSIDSKLELLEEMEDTVVNSLYKAYAGMLKEKEEAQIKDAADGKEVLEQIKK